MRGRWNAAVVMFAVIAVGAGWSAFAASAGATRAAATQPGVSKTEIRVGGVVSKTNPLNGPYASSFDGVKAYFSMVNAKGGIHGRKLRLVSEHDDQIVQNQKEVQATLERDNVFAVLPIATIFAFSGAQLLADQKVPAFGWGINAEWTGPENLFGIGGSNCFDCATPLQPGIVKMLGKKKVGLLAYNVANSKICAEVNQEAFEKYPTAKVEYISTSLSFGETNFAVEVKAMKDKGIDYVTTCLDQNAVVNLSKEMKKQGMNAVQYLPNAYDHEFVRANKDFLAGSLVHVSFAPFETKPAPKGLKDFNKWMDKAGSDKNELAMMGWMSADLFVTGLRKAGPAFTRQKVVDALNAPEMEDYTIQGLQPGAQTINHTKVSEITCTAVVKIAADGTFKPWKAKPGKPFLCWPDHPAKVPAKPVNK